MCLGGMREDPYAVPLPERLSLPAPGVMERRPPATEGERGELKLMVVAGLKVEVTGGGKVKLGRGDLRYRVPDFFTSTSSRNVELKSFVYAIPLFKPL